MNIPCAVVLLYNMLVHHLSSILVKRCFIFFNILNDNCATTKVIFVNKHLAYILSVRCFRLSLAKRWLAFGNFISTYQKQRESSYKPSSIFETSNACIRTHTIIFVKALLEINDFGHVNIHVHVWITYVSILDFILKL